MPENLTPAGSQVVPPATNAPQVGNNHSQSTPADPQAGSESQQQQSTLTVEQYADLVRKLRDENASHRTRNRELEGKVTEFERSKLSAEERLQASLADKERALTELQRQHQETITAHALERAAVKAGIVDPDAVKLLDMSLLEYDSDGRPKNAEKLLKELVAAKPWIAGGTQASAAAGAPQGGSATNPARGNSQTMTFRDSQVRAMSPADYAKNKLAINQALREGRYHFD